MNRSFKSIAFAIFIFTGFVFTSSVFGDFSKVGYNLADHSKECMIALMTAAKDHKAFSELTEHVCSLCEVIVKKAGKKYNAKTKKMVFANGTTLTKEEVEATFFKLNMKDIEKLIEGMSLSECQTFYSNMSKEDKLIAAQGIAIRFFDSANHQDKLKSTIDTILFMVYVGAPLSSEELHKELMSLLSNENIKKEIDSIRREKFSVMNNMVIALKGIESRADRLKKQLPPALIEEFVIAANMGKKRVLKGKDEKTAKSLFISSLIEQIKRNH